MPEFGQRIERDALRAAAHLLPARWQRVIDVLAAPVPPTPDQTVPAPDDDAVSRLAGIDHIVVLMMENRSFDHLLGYLSLPVGEGGRGRADVDGLTGPETNVNLIGDSRYSIHHLDRTKFAGELEDPDHSGNSVTEQIADGRMDGFAANFQRISHARAAAMTPPGVEPDPGLVMGYYTAADVPVYDHLAAEYCVVDRWFSSVPGATWPNRLYSLTGRAAGSRDDISPPLYALPSFVRYLDECQVDWRWYSFDPATLRAADPAYRLSDHHRFAYVDARKLSTEERAAGELMREGSSFLDDVAAGQLPAVSWIDPHFKDLAVLGPDSNDDHPPSDLAAGQDLALTVYHALSSSPQWARTMLVIVYDEHGGLYDHVPPPAATDDDPGFQRLGVRVPALIVSPLVTPGSTATALLGRDVHFDHTSIIKTILARFCVVDGRIPRLSARVAAAPHLGHLLTAAGAPRMQVPDHSHLTEQAVSWRARWSEARFADPVAAGGAPGTLTDFQTGFYEMARLLRTAGLPTGHP
jgi:phospholipase C